MAGRFNIGTCSWKYDSWDGLVYSRKKPDNYLQEYSQRYSTVEVDQWFWSLFTGDKVVLPKPAVVEEYVYSVPDDFKFGVKVPNAITLSHYYSKKNEPLIPNPHFLSVKIMENFLDSISAMTEKLGPLMFQFEYLNKQKMPGGLSQFIDQFGEFAEQLPPGMRYCVECRNPNYLSKKYFTFLETQGLSHVFLQGYYMPSIFQVYGQYKQQINDYAVIRLHGPNRQGIEKVTGKNWSKVVVPRNDDIKALVGMLQNLELRKAEAFLYVNNHFEGSAPRTIERIEDVMDGK